MTGENFRAGLGWRGSDERCELRDLGAGNAETGTKIIKEGTLEFPTGLGLSTY